VSQGNYAHLHFISPGTIHCIIRYCLVSNVTNHCLDDRGKISDRERDFSRLHHVQINSDINPLSYPTGTRSCFMRVKWPEREVEALM
jgi:hypothetical protein